MRKIYRSRARVGGMVTSIFCGVALCGSVIGCTISEQRFSPSYGDTLCRKWKKCDKEEFQELWENVESCSADTSELVDAFLDIGDTLGGEYDSSAAYRCLGDLRSANCDELANWEFSDACDDVID